jgi:hypothetical protein
MATVLNQSPTSARIINTGSVYGSNSIALNAMVELGGSDVKISVRPDSSLVYIISPSDGIYFGQKPNSALLSFSKPINGGILKGYESNVPTGIMTGQPMGLLLALTYN